MGAFLAQDLLLFVLFFDLMLVPFFFLVGSYGTGDRVRATIKMMVYTLVGSLLMLVAAIATAVLTAETTGDLSFAMADLRANVLPEGSQEWIFLFFAAAFLVKMPTFPLHGWMPDAYRAAPLPVLALLSGVLPKVAAYGFLRVALPIFPDATVRVPGADPGPRPRLGHLRLDDGVHADERAPGRRLLVDRAARLHHARDLLADCRRRQRLGAPDGQPRARGGPDLPDHRDPRRALRHRGPARDGRRGDAGARAGGGVPDRHDGHARDARLGQLHRRVLHPERPLRRRDGLRRDRDGWNRDGRLLRAPPVPEDDAQPASRRASSRAR